MKITKWEWTHYIDKYREDALANKKYQKIIKVPESAILTA